jgi:myo-inositol-1(or 4)-monophosphatase
MGKPTTVVTNHAALLAVAHDAVDAAHDILLTRAPGQLTAKGDRDMASEVDFAIERQLRDLLQRRTPGIGFLGEENGRTGATGDLVWTLDPVDGTANFVHGSPLCGISLGLLDGPHPILGVIDLPFLGTRYSAAVGQGAFRGKAPIHVSTTTALEQAIVAIGDYAVGRDAADGNRHRLAITARLASTVQRVRMHGSAAIDLAWLAGGAVDAVIIMSNKPWDTAAGAIIAAEAGARVSDTDGISHSIRSRATLAANPGILPAIIDLVAAAADQP